MVPTSLAQGEQRDISLHILGGRNYWKIPWKMSKCFSYTVSFTRKVIKYAKKHGNRAAKRQFGTPPTESAIRLWGNRKTASSDDKTEEGSARKPPKWLEVEQEVKNWILGQSQTVISVSTKMTQEGKRTAGEKNIDDFSGTPTTL